MTSQEKKRCYVRYNGVFVIAGCHCNCKGPHTINTANVGSTRDLISQNKCV